ncbi:MAG: hypothetical protein CMB67_02870 [Euryarchaeota archaeon]|nr:hypothetical protein [Euryarchaeota archaeon]
MIALLSNRESRSPSPAKEVIFLSARNETPHKVIQALGKKKCNGSWEASIENLTMDQVKSIAEEQKGRLTGKSLYARCREVMGTCVAMRVRVEGLEPKVALKEMSEGAFNEHFS